MTASRHLDRVITRHEQIANLQVVFVDVEKYSKRRTQAQVGVIRSFTQSLEDALTDVSKRYVSYSQTNDINLRDDTIVIPTGDGAAIGFSFDGLHDIHLNFALDLLRRAHELRSSDRCDKFEQNGWCHCHPYFNLLSALQMAEQLSTRT